MNNPIYETKHQMGEHSKPVIILLLCMLPLIGAMLVSCAFYAAYAVIALDGYPLSIGLSLFVIVAAVGFTLIHIGWKFITAGLAKYRFAPNGIYAKYPLKPEVFYPWSVFQQVCVCYSAYTTRGPQKANTIICCIKHGEKKNLYGRWKTENPFRYRTVICVNFSLDLLYGVKEMCPFEVIDLRNTPAYKIR